MKKLPITCIVFYLEFGTKFSGSEFVPDITILKILIYVFKSVEASQPRNPLLHRPICYTDKLCYELLFICLLSFSLLLVDRTISLVLFCHSFYFSVRNFHYCEQNAKILKILVCECRAGSQ